MTSHDHHPSSTDRPAPGSQPANLGNPIQRYAAGEDPAMTSPEDLPARPPETAGPPSSASGKRQAASGKRISIDYIRDLFKLGRTAAGELTHRPGFPDSVKISPHCYRWWASEWDEFAATLRRERARFLPTRLEPGSAGS
jgi:hypothetical protein